MKWAPALIPNSGIGYGNSNKKNTLHVSEQEGIESSYRVQLFGQTDSQKSRVLPSYRDTTQFCTSR